MPSCSPSTLAVKRPSQDTFAKCSSRSSSATIPTCGQLGPMDCCDKESLGPRENRDRVRDQIRDAVMLELGAPVIDLELDQQQLDYAVDRALKTIEEYAPREYFDYYSFMTTPGKSVYELPPDVGFVRNVYYQEMGQTAFSAGELGGVIPLEYFAGGVGYENGFLNPTQPVWGQMGPWVLYKQYEQMFSRVSSALGGWEWVGGFRHIKLYPTPCRPSYALVHYIQRCKDWTCVTDSMIEGAIAYAKIMVGRIRSKFQNIPGPSGGIILDGQAILQEGNQEKKEWEERLITRFGDVLPITMG